MAALSRAALPVTPDKRTKDKAEIEKVIRKLNSECGIDIGIPDLTLSPNERRERGARDKQFARWDRIYRGIQFLYYQRGDVLKRALDSFFSEANTASQLWAPRPSVGSGAFPPTCTPFKAQTMDQRENLQNILIKVISDYMTRVTQSLRLSQPCSTTTNAPDPDSESNESSPNSASESPSSASSKRSFDRDDDHEFKRLRAREFSALRYSSPASIDALDKVPSRRRLGEPLTYRSPKQRHVNDGPYGSSPTASSNSSSSSSDVSNLFSRAEGQQLSQTPPDEDIHEKRLLATRGLAFSQPIRCGLPRRSAPGMFAFEDLKDTDRHPSHRSPASGDDVSSLDDIGDVSADTTLETTLRDGSHRLLESSKLDTIRSRLQNIWPKFPAWLHDAPLAVAWEITRICLHCKVDPENTVRYDHSWASSDILTFRRKLWQLDIFRGKSFPELPSDDVFRAALDGFENKGNTVVMSASLEFNPKKDGPLFLLDMKPLHFEQGCRLTRRFGSDRFLEVLIQSPDKKNMPSCIKNTEGAAAEIIRWLTQQPHSLVGRRWRAFYARDAGYRKPVKDYTTGPDSEAKSKERIQFFAESGPNFRPVVSRSLHIPTDTAQQRTELKVTQMLDWLLQLENNQDQPYLKLFSRIQLGLSKTIPTVTFEPDQVRHRSEDIVSPIGKVMNDGIGLMSRTVARKIRDILGLTDIPSAIQARIGSAKGMWLVDVTDCGDEDWIETYPSQRKWNCDDTHDPFHRTLEVRNVVSELKPAHLNLQFLPVLEDRAKNKEAMRCTIRDRLLNCLQKEFEDQKEAMKRPLQFRQWVNENSNTRWERVRQGQVPFLGGLPADKTETLSLLLSSGFDPNSQEFVRRLAYELRLDKCKTLQTKLNIKIGRSAYIYMVADFWGVLEENQVHVAFSSKFTDDLEGTSYTLLADCDVLVARSPAHFVSDIQKVRAVFRPELHALKDVIVFSTKGDVPLAEKLSGGDYDGDIAWVCWDPDIVDNFENAEVPTEPDLSAYLDKNKTTFGELVHRTGRSGRRALHQAVHEMIDESFQFALQPSYLGICTNYKERVCYWTNSVNDEGAILLSSLLGKLVDQSKQGIIFTENKWNQLRKDKFSSMIRLDDPPYKSKKNTWPWPGVKPSHIIDYLKFAVASRAIKKELNSLHSSMVSAPSNDLDLVRYYKHLDDFAANTGSRSIRLLLEALIKSIESVKSEWDRNNPHHPRNTLSYPDVVKKVYPKWLEIDFASVSSQVSGRIEPGLTALLEQRFLADRGAGATSYWALLKASTAFHLYHHTARLFVWQMAGYQLAFIKAQMSAGAGGMPVLVTPLMYAGMMSDGRFVKQYVARLEGDGSEYLPGVGGRENGDEFEREDDVN